MKIFINGGLGNQLFQLAYSHQDTLMREKGYFEIVKDPDPREDRPFDLDPVLEVCQHWKRNGVAQQHIGRLFYFASRVAYKLSKLMKLSSRGLFSASTYFEIMPFKFSPPTTNDSKLHMGYFQHWKYVENAWISLGKELEETIKGVLLPSNLQFLQNQSTCVIHIRRGDLARNANTMGILDVTFYKKAIIAIETKKQTTLNLVGITDDVVGAEKISKDLGLDLLLSPSDLSSWQSLALMARSGAVICANSTFSWWGGILSAKNGGAVVVPDPWFLNWHEEIGNSFLHPQFIPIASSFLKKLDFYNEFSTKD